MAELGDTNNLDELIPGKPDELARTVASLAQYAALLQDAGKGLSGIDTTSGWSGRAADKFRATYHPQPAQWMRGADAFLAAASALDSYAASLSSAQQQAARAIDLWDSGKANHPAAVDVLTSARNQLDIAGNAAADAVDKAAAQAPPAPGFWSQVGSDLSGWGGDALHGAESFGKDAVSELASLGEDAVNGLASLGNAGIHDPGGLAATAGGSALAALGAAGDAGGTLLAATGIGAPVGVPIDVASTGAVLAGGTIAAGGVTSIVRDALGPDRVTLMQSSSASGSGGGGGGGGGDAGGGDDLAQALGGGTGAGPSWVDGNNFLSRMLGNPILDQTITAPDGTSANVFGQITRSGDSVTVSDVSMNAPDIEGEEGGGGHPPLVNQIGPATIRSAGEQLLKQAAPAGVRQVTFSGVRTAESSGVTERDVNLTVYFDEGGSIKWRMGP